MNAPLRWWTVGALCLVLILAACSQPSPAPTSAPATAGPLDTAAPTPALATLTPASPPTATPVPLAAMVNGQAITLAEYEAEVERCRLGRAEAGHDPEACPALVLEELIAQVVVEQAAVAAGLAVSDAEVDAALARIVTEAGGPEAHAEWLAANLYSAETFREALRREMLRVRAAEQVTSQVGPTAEQVHARAILVTTPETAQDLLARLQGGADFATLALDYSRDLSSRVAGGDLGWFPRGTLTVPEVEEAAFALQAGELSGVIVSEMGYHIVQVLERDPARGLSPAAAQTLRAAAYQAWLQARLAEATVERYAQP